MFSLVFLTIALICALFAPIIAPHSPIETNPANILKPPSITSGNLLGTDNQGRDLLSRLIYGAQTSVMIGVLSVLLAAAVGTVIGLVSGVYRGWVDRILMRVTDGFLALPYLMVALTAVALLGSSVINVILVIGLLRWMGFARVLRGEVLKLIEMDFVRLALASGASRTRIMITHVFPNITNTLLVLATLEIGLAVIVEASLSFLGLGVPRPMPSWGSMLRDSQLYIYLTWWFPIIPGIAITLLVMSANLTGDWLRDRLDPTRRQL
ncbi:MAG: ABC transporter permease [Rhodospirillaceae bacterium]|nr:ABC transporter permease [Rhodospirillaceae bacterium]MDD9918826.1 ABC transporter permease [Rhodospirillaceae bacterium]MDD9925035.1 ABC transporter permease [Rhodospirillaceae bacterium]